MRDLDAAAGAAPDFFLVALQHVEGAAADGADAEQADLDGFHCDTASAGCADLVGVPLAIVLEEVRDAADRLGAGRRRSAGRRCGSGPASAS